MFIGAEIRLEVSFNAAQAKLANMARGGLLGRASGGAYDEWQAGLARVGPRGIMLGMSRLARVRIRDMVTRGDSAIWAMRWEIADRRGALVPALDAEIKLTPAGEDATLLTVSGICQPLAGLAADLDPALMHQVAQATIQAFTSHIATDIADPVTAPDACHSKMLPEPVPEAQHRDPKACDALLASRFSYQLVRRPGSQHCNSHMCRVVALGPYVRTSGLPRLSLHERSFRRPAAGMRQVPLQYQ